ncbi:MAG TPA: serine hydrolase [Flavitalea sp.]|nr:serine hydrolase [Flavitalea sp.]
MKYYLIISIAVFCINGCVKPQIEETTIAGQEIPWTDSSNIHPQHTAFESLIRKYHGKGLPGISLLVNDKAGTWVGSVGNADLKTNMSFLPGTISKVASVTKFFMGVLMFKLFEDSASTGIGYTALHQPLSTWISAEVLHKIPNGMKVTLGQVMNHESGIPDVIEMDDFYLEVLNDPNKKWTASELLGYVEGKDPVFDPGDTAIYSNTNTILVSMVIEAVTRKAHSDVLKQRVLQPLGLLNTFYQPHDVLPASVAQGYFDLYNNNTLVNVSNLVTGAGNGYGGIYSNLFDLHKLIESVLVKKTFLSAQSLSIMETYGKADGSNKYGYGIMKKFIERGENFGIGHSGRDLGYTCNLFYFPASGVTHIFLINYGTDGDSDLKQVFLDFQQELLDITTK